MTRLAPAVLLFAAAAVATAHARPDPDRPAYTAFPALKAPVRPVEQPDGTTTAHADLATLYARLRAAADRPLPPGATPAATVRSHQLKAGADYLRRAHIRLQVAANAFDGKGPGELAGMVGEVYRLAAGGAADPAGLFEERVRVLKELERATGVLVTAGRVPPAWLALVRYHRLAAEGELLDRTAGE